MIMTQDHTVGRVTRPVILCCVLTKRAPLLPSPGTVSAAAQKKNVNVMQKCP